MKQLKIKNHINYKINFFQYNHLLKFGKFGIKSKNFTLIFKNQLDSFNFIILKKLKEIEPKKKVKIWNCILLNFNATKLVSESQMGKGKGSVYSSVVFIKPGTILFEFDNINYYKMINFFLFIKKKFPFEIFLVK